jgi:hypothetical protein
MSKNIPPVMGYNFHEIKKDLFPDTLNSTVIDCLDATNVSTDDEEEVSAATKSINNQFDCPTTLGLINQNACATNQQIGYLFEALGNYEDKKEGISKTINNALESLPFAQLANSFRLDCSDCLNGKCKRRDPQCPVSEVEKRVPSEK